MKKKYKKKKKLFDGVLGGGGVVWGLGARGTQESHFRDEKMGICPAGSGGKSWKYRLIDQIP